MKKMTFSLAFACVALFSVAKENEIKVKPQTKEVMVYLQNAQVYATAEVNLSVGTFDIILQELSQHIDENSVQVKGDADFTILSVVVKKDYMNSEKKDPRTTALADSVENMEQKIALTNNSITGFNEELELLRANQKIGGNNTGVTAMELEKVTNFYRARFNELNSKIFEAQRRVNKMQEQLANLRRQLAEQGAKANRIYSEITVSVKSNAAGKSNLSLRYMVRNAGWLPYYDIRSENSSAPIQIISKANVYQNTGEDWKNVKLSLSTGNPTQSNTKPDLLAFYLNPIDENELNRRVYSRGARDEAAPAMYESMEGDVPQAAKQEMKKMATKNMNSITSLSQSSYELTANIEGQTNNIFDISIPYNIPSDGKEYAVEIQKYEVKAQYTYTAIPKLDKDAFLLANLIKWEQTGLLPGDANIFYEGTYVGKSYFETRNTNDTIPISLGRDKNIVVERKRVKNMNEKNMTGSTKTSTQEYEIIVRNKKKTEIEISLEDQIPLSNREEVEVNLIESGKAEYNKERGNLTWNLKLKPAETITLRFSFSVKYPKRFIISNL